MIKAKNYFISICSISHSKLIYLFILKQFHNSNRYCRHRIQEIIYFYTTNNKLS